jgi:uncharacterized membrane protein YgcG
MLPARSIRPPRLRPPAPAAAGPGTAPSSHLPSPLPTALAFAAAVALSAALAFAATLAIVPGVRAQDRPQLTGPVTDLVGAVTGQEASIETAIDALRSDEQVQLWVLYDDDTGDVSATTYATEIATENGLGAGDALYVVALDARTYALWLSDALADRVTSDQQDRILIDAEDQLIQGAYAGAAIAVAEGLGDALAAGPVDSAAPTAGQTEGSGGGPVPGEGDQGSGGSLLPVVAAALVIAIVMGVIFFVVDRRTRARSRERRAQLGAESNALLLATDEAIKNARQEIGFVEAMYSEAEVAPYAAAVEEASGQLNAAFEIRQKLDDSIPEDAATQERMLTEIVDRTKAAQALLGAQQERIREMRALERDAPKLLEGLAGQAAALGQRLARAAETRASLESYAPANWDAVRGNRTEAEKRIEFAREDVAEGQAALASGDMQRAVVAVRASTQAVTEATALLDAIDAAARDLAAARDRIPIEIREAETDIASARTAMAGRGIPDAPARIAQAEATLAEARRLAAATPQDVLGALERANAAEAIADELLAGIRAADEARARQAAMLEGAIASAQARVELASGYVATRRHGVGDTARVRTAEAQRHLEQARSLRSQDPTTALAEARRAEELANDAYRRATGDFGGWDQRQPSPVGPTGGDIAGAIIGGIIGGMLAGGGGPGWGGTSWGGRGGGRGGPPIPRIPMPGGGGGGRARGGRW